MTTLYEKRGRRYHPVREEMHYNSFPSGAHLVIVNPGQKSVRYSIAPDHAALLVAAESIRDFRALWNYPRSVDLQSLTRMISGGAAI